MPFQVLMETNNVGTIQATYTYGQGLISMRRNGTDVYYHSDGLGSVKQLTDSGGIVTANYTYDSFGNSVGSVSSVANIISSCEQCPIEAGRKSFLSCCCNF